MRRALIAAAAVLVLLLGAGAGVYAYLRSNAFRLRLENYVVGALQQGSGARVEIGAFHLTLRPLSLDLDRLLVHGREPAGQPPLAAIPHLHVGIRLVSLLHRQVSLGAVTMEQPRFHVYLLADGAVNLPQPHAPWARRRQEARTLFDLGARSLVISQGELDLEDRRIPLALHWSGVGLRLEAERGSAPAFTGELRFQRGATRWGRLPALPLDADLRFTLAPDALRLDHVLLQTPGLRLEAQGGLSDFAAPRLDLRYQMQADLAAGARTAAIPGAPREGHAQSAGRWQWSPAGWRLEARLGFTAVRWSPAGPGPWSGQAAFQATPQGLVVTRLDLEGLGGQLRLRGGDPGWRAAALEGTVAGLRLSALLPLLRRAAATRDLAADLQGFSARVAGTVHFRATGRLADRAHDQVALALALTPETAADGATPLAGRLEASWMPAGGVLAIQRLEATAAGATVQASGRIAAGVATLQLAAASPDLDRLRPWIARAAAQLAPARLLPSFAGGGSFQGTLRGSLAAPTLAGHLRLAPVRYGAASFEAVTADASLGPGGLRLASATLQQGTQRLTLSGAVALAAYRLAPGATLALDLVGTHIGLARAQRLVGLDYPVAGALGFHVALRGTWSHPQGDGQFQIVQLRWRNQVVQSATAAFHLQNDQLTSSNLEVALAHTRIRGTLRLGLADHSYQVNVSSPAVQLADVALLQSPRLALSGQVRFQLTGSGRWEAPQGELILTTSGLRGGGESLGDLGARLQLGQGQIQFQAADILTNGSFNLAGTVAVAAPYSIAANLHLRDYDFDAWLRRFTPAQLSGHSLISGTASLEGPLAHPDLLAAHIALDPVQLALSGLVIHNQGPILFTAAQRRITLEPARIVAQDTDFTLAGQAALGESPQSPSALAGQLQGSLEGHINLALIESLHPATHAAGQLAVAAQLAGTLSQPRLLGRITIRNARLSEQDFPIGFDDIQGALNLTGNRVQIEQLTARTGSGALAITGFAARTAAGLDFDLDARGQNLRLRYQGISTTGNLQLRLSGQPRAALLAGTAQLTRVGLDPDFDLALFIAASQSTAAPPDTDSVLNRVRLDVHLVTGPQVEVATNLARLQLQADLRLRGTLADPAVLGSASAGAGRILFAGNQYQVTKAQVRFTNPFRIEPLLDVGLSTTVQQYDITLNIAGPADKLAITYRSDPPLASSDVIALLATGQPTPATAALGNASAAAGASQQLLGQALENLVAGRMRRLFGVTQVKVNPDTGELASIGSGGTVTILQQVSRNLKLTYTQNLSSRSQDIIQVDWTISRDLGITLNRDQFGLYGLKFTLRQRAR